MPQRINYISFLNVIAALAVLYLHINGCFWNFHPEPYWAQANVIESVFYFAVPVFFMICGATNLNYREKYSTKTFLVRRAKKTVIPFIAWNVVALVYNVLTDVTPISDVSIGYFIIGILSNSIEYIYWFFWALFGIYLIIPILSAIPKGNRISIYSYIVLLNILLQIIPSFVLSCLNIQFELPVCVTVGSTYIVYVLLGYILNEIKLSRVNKILIYIGALAGLLVHTIGTYYLSIKAGMIIETYKGYENLPCLVYSVGVYVLLQSIASKISSEKFWKVINFISGYTFPIYLMHIYVWRISTRLGIYSRSLTVRLLMPYLVMVICIIITYFLRKIPIIKHIVP